MKHDEIEIRDCFPVFGLKNVLVDVELESVVPVVRVWEMCNGGVICEFVCAVGFCDFAASLPVVDHEGGGGSSGCSGVYEFIDHIDRPCNSCFFVEHRPLCSVGSEGIGEVLVEVEKVFELWGGGGVGGGGGGGGVGGGADGVGGVVKAFYFVMHFSSCCCCFLSGFGP